MRFQYSLLLLFLFFTPAAFALNLDTVQAPATEHRGLRISILTCGVGEELYASFGHTGVRIIDSAAGTDAVYNYGVFNFSDPDFYTKFTLGRLLYYIDKGSFRQFMDEYEEDKRIVREQVLSLPDTAKQQIQQYLETNLLPQNRGYYYNFLYDNCATRVRDIFPKALGSAFRFGAILDSTKISYRATINHYLSQKHWERLGINLLLGRPVDEKMTDDGSMFLPDYLHRGLAGATFNNHPLVTADHLLQGKGIQTTHPLDSPLWMNIGIFILTLLCFHSAAFRYLKGVICFLLLFVSGLLGCFMLFMWLGTEHTACSQNFNILWALPANILIAFVAIKKRSWLKYYGIVAAAALLAALVLHVFGVQQLPLFELTPFLLSLLYVYADLWRWKKPDSALSSAT